MKYFRAAALLFSILMSVFVLAGCQKPPIDGDFISTRGSVTVTLKDGKFSSGNGALNGTFTVNNDHSVKLLGATGAVYEGFMPYRYSIFINKENGRDSPGFSWIRVGTKSANEILAMDAARKQSDASPPPDAFKPDRSVPLSDYTAIDNSIDAAMVLIPWSGKPMPDDELLRQFTSGGSSSNAFERQDAINQALPRFHARMDDALKQRYYTIAIGRNPKRGDFVFSQLFLNAYDLSKKSFRLTAVGTDCWHPHEININRFGVGYGFLIDQSDKPCEVSVPDEATARQIEDLRARSMLEVQGTIGVCITHIGPRNGRVFVALTYAHVVLTTTRGPAFKFETDL